MDFQIKGKEVYKVLQQIEHGTSKYTYLAEGQETQKKFALKVLRQQPLGQGEQNEYYLKEINYISSFIDQKLYHENIVNFEDIIVNKEEQVTYLISEYCDGGNLFQYIVNNEVISEKEQLEISLQIAKGIQWLHSHNIAHRDIKAESIIIKKQGDNLLFKITDFGYSSQTNNYFTSVIGTINYLAPEILKSQKYGMPVDIWSLGCLMYEIAFRSQLFNDNSIQVLVNKILNFQEPPTDNNQKQSLLYDIIKKCLAPVPTDRAKINYVVDQLTNKLIQSSNQDFQMVIRKGVRFSDEVLEKNQDLKNNAQFGLKRIKTIGSLDEILQESGCKSEMKQQFEELMIEFQGSKYAKPKENGMISNFFYKSSTKPKKFVEDNGIYKLDCPNDEKFYSGLFHFLICGQLLACLQDQKQRIGELPSSEIDPFQNWVKDILKFSILNDTSEKKNEFEQFQKALAQIANVKDIYFRVNNYLNWYDDPTYYKQMLVVTKLIYEQLNKGNQFLSQTKLAIFDSQNQFKPALVENASLYDLFIIQEYDSNSRTIIMPSCYLQALLDITLIFENHEDRDVSKLINQFKETLIQEQIINFLKKKITSSHYFQFLQDYIPNSLIDYSYDISKTYDKD